MTCHAAYLLRRFEEVVGPLSSVKNEDGVLVAKVGKIAVYLPSEMETVLRPLVGKKIGILRCDTGYRSRVINSSRHDEQIIEAASAEGRSEVVG
ncbi:MAG: hypothetical protein JW724_08090 [Candidatus Altiarchaeota archaeon]|nr:hypothetical protein [Candidatus Altiarchaeota archaeon]